MYDEGPAPGAPNYGPASAPPPISQPVAATASPAATPYPSAPTQQAPRKRRWWIWLAVLAVLFFCAIVSCLPLALLSDFGSTSGGAFTGLTNGAVAVIPIDAAIQGTGNNAVTPSTFYDQIRQAEKDSRVKAIVLRVDSPGGTVAASEEIASYVKNAHKPVVVSVGDICASGAYMISSQADKIYAIEGSDVGSIGVILQIPNVQGLLDKLGITVNTITAGKFKGEGSPYRKLTPEEQKRLQGQVDEVYGQFITIVATGRRLPEAKVRELATGEVWTGVQAKKLGLIDEIGTYPDALAAAAKLGGIEGEPEVITYDRPLGGLLSSLTGIFSQVSPYGQVVPAPRESVPK